MDQKAAACHSRRHSGLREAGATGAHECTPASRAPVELVCALSASLFTSYRKWPSMYQRTYSPGDQSCGGGGRQVERYEV